MEDSACTSSFPGRLKKQEKLFWLERLLEHFLVLEFIRRHLVVAKLSHCFPGCHFQKGHPPHGICNLYVYFHFRVRKRVRESSPVSVCGKEGAVSRQLYLKKVSWRLVWLPGGRHTGSRDQRMTPLSPTFPNVACFKNLLVCCYRV